MGLASTKNFTKQLDLSIHNIWLDEYTSMAEKSLYQKYAKKMDPPPGKEIREAELSPLGELREINEGSGVDFDIPEEGNEKARTYSKYGLGFQLTEETLQDDVHGKIQKMPKMLGRSAAYKPETVFWDLFNSGFATHQSIDGQYIFSNSHSTLKTGETIDNLTTSSLSETTLQAAFQYFDDMVDDAGLPLLMDGFVLLVPNELQWTAATLAKTSMKPGSMDNDINTVKDRGGWVWDKIRYLTSSTAWFMISVADHDFRIVWKKKTTMKSADDFNTDNRLYKVTNRFTAFCNKYRGCYGANA